MMTAIVTDTCRDSDTVDELVGDRLDTLQYKVFQGAGLTMDERLERQGLIFNHAGRMPSRNDRQPALPAASRRKAIRGASARRSNAEAQRSPASGDKLPPLVGGAP